ncbi:MAG: dCTP deaminase [archaeon]
MILGSEKILELCKEGLLENFEEKHIESCGVDLRIGKIYRLKSGAKLGVDDRQTPEIEEVAENTIILKPNEYVLVETMEKVNMPSDLCAWMRQRSTLQRCGVSLFTALIDPGFNGTLTFGMKNQGEFEFEVERGARVGQIIFEKVEGGVKKYDGKYQGGKVV